MSGSVNKVILVGNAGRDPEVRTMTNGGKVAEIRLATSESWKDKTSGERQEKTEWHSVQVFNEGLIGIIERFVKKGTKLYIEGAIQTRKYQVDGQDKYTTEIILRGPGAVMTMLSGSGEGGEGGGDMGGDRSGGGQRGGQAQGGGQQRRAAPPAARDDFDDDVPF